MGLDWEINDPLVPSATREVSPALGRWTTPDAFGGDVSNPQSLNRYAYVLDNPASLVDPLGLNGDCSWDVNTTITGTSGTLNCPIDGGWDVVSSSAGGCAPMYVNGGYVGSTCGTGTDNQGGRRNGGVSGGGSSASTGGPVPSYSQVLKSFNRCAANFADKYSVASLLHLNNSFIGNALLGSTTAAVSNLFLQSDPKVYVPAGTNLGAGANAGAAVKIGAIAAGKLPVGGTMYAYTGATVATQYGPALEMAPVGKTLADTALGSSSLGGVKALGGLLDIALPAQILYDEALYGVGEAACTAQAF